ncbi:unnamed protein product [Effrenium voratum]|nr:unnamed protein product [Effrenium voratum]
MGTTDEEVQKAHAAIRQILAAVHVTDVLPERARMLAVDVKLPVKSVLLTVLSEQQSPHRGGAPAESQGSDLLRREGRERLEETGLITGAVSAAYPTDVLAEVCEIDAVTQQLDGPEPDEKTPAVRRWTSPDDGWGTHPLLQSDLEKMPMGMPVTVGELAEFLSHALAKDAGDMMDWSLEQWRAHRLSKQPAGEEDKKSQLDLVEGPSGPVLVHRVPCAPPRPILCADDPEATLLKAVQLLLAYPECNALPVVSPIRLTVMAYLTLSSCLAFVLSRLRGEQLVPLVQHKIQAPAAAVRSIYQLAGRRSLGAESESAPSRAAAVLCQDAP